MTENQIAPMPKSFSLSHLQDKKTPFFYYDLNLLNDTLAKVKDCSSQNGFEVHYALKANARPELLKQILAYGLGADCVSGNEISAALEAGFPPESIVFAGVGKTDEEIRLALEAGIFSFNAESLEELEVINEIAEKLGKKATIALRINPDVDAQTHHYITTGLEENKFGISSAMLEDILDKVMRLNHVEIKGLHFHVGSQILDLDVFKHLCLKVNFFYELMVKKGFSLSFLNLGGGLGIDYHHPDEGAIPDFERYFDVFKTHLKVPSHVIRHFELGRSIVGQCGNLVSKVIYVKKGLNKQFVILDAGMTELIRPALYQAYHLIENMNTDAEANTHMYDVVGPVCESSDCFAKNRSLPETKRGDLLLIRSVGAYGEVMSSGYNMREKPGSFFSQKK